LELWTGDGPKFVGSAHPRVPMVSGSIWPVGGRVGWGGGGAVHELTYDIMDAAMPPPRGCEQQAAYGHGVDR